MSLMIIGQDSPHKSVAQSKQKRIPSLCVVGRGPLSLSLSVSSR